MRIKKVGTMKLVLGKESDQCHRPRLPARSLIYRYCHTAPCPVLYPAYHPLSSWASQLVLQTMPKCNLSTLKSTKTCSTPPSPSSEKNNLQLVHQASPSDCPHLRAWIPATLETVMYEAGAGRVSSSGTQSTGQWIRSIGSSSDTEVRVRLGHQGLKSTTSACSSGQAWVLVLNKAQCFCLCFKECWLIVYP